MTIIIGCISYFIYNICVILVYFLDIIWLLWVIIMVTAGINGYGSGLYWVGQGAYMSQTIEEETRSYYMGIFYGSLSCASVFGGLITAFLLELIPPWIVILILAIVCGCGVIPLLFLEFVEFVDPVISENERKATFQTTGRQPINRLLPLFGYTGIFVGFAIGLFPYWVGSTVEDDLLIKVALTTTFLSLGQGTGGFIWARVSQVIPEHYILIISLCLMTGGGVMTMILTNFSYTYVWFVAAFLHGQSDGAQLTVTQKLASIHGMSNVHAFTWFRILHAACAGVLLIVAPFLLPVIPVYALVVIVLGIDAIGSILASISNILYGKNVRYYAENMSMSLID